MNKTSSKYRRHDTGKIALTGASSVLADAYRALHFNLGFTSLDKPLETLVISSPSVDETKSDVATNLAIVMAQAGKRVVLVDADLRRPSLHEVFSVPSDPGLSTAIASQGKQLEIPLVATEVEGLSLLPSGVIPPNPSDILASRRMEDFLALLKDQSDIVILDAPPVIVAVDATVLAAKTDGLLLVVRSGHTRRDHISQAKQLLERSHVRLLGAVLTDSPESGLWTGY